MTEPVKYKSLYETPCHWVSEVEQLRDLATKLAEVPIFAVDLEVALLYFAF